MPRGYGFDRVDWISPLLHQIDRQGSNIMYADEARRRNEAADMQKQAFALQLQKYMAELDREAKRKQMLSQVPPGADINKLGMFLLQNQDPAGLELMVKAAEIEARKKEAGYEIKPNKAGEYVRIPKTPGGTPEPTGVLAAQEKWQAYPPTTQGLTPYQEKMLEMQNRRLDILAENSTSANDKREADVKAKEANVKVKEEQQALREDQFSAKQRDEYTKDLFHKETITAGLKHLSEKVEKIKTAKGIGGVTGLYGKIPDYPGSEASMTRADLESLKAEVGYQVLSDMRAASKTGGAVGNVSDFETKTLQSTLEALDPTKFTPKEFLNRLDGIVKYAEAATKRINSAFEKQWKGREPKGGNESTPAREADNFLNNFKKGK